MRNKRRGRPNRKAPEQQRSAMSAPKYCHDPDNCTYSDCPTAFCDRKDQHSLAAPSGSHSVPIRVQLSRRKGWRLPENTVVVSRPSEFGNPFKLLELVRGKKYTVQTLVSFGSRCWWGSMHVTPSDMDQRAARQHAVECFELWLNGDTTRTDVILPEGFTARIREKLRGKNVACWCPLDGPCHADELLKIANQ